jgi:hypothetical protein
MPLVNPALSQQIFAEQYYVLEACWSGMAVVLTSLGAHFPLARCQPHCSSRGSGLLHAGVWPRGTVDSLSGRAGRLAAGDPALCAAAPIRLRGALRAAPAYT